MKRDIITEKIKKIEEYIPNTEKYSIRLDANESPFLPSEEIMSEFHAALDKIEFDRYPDPYATELVESFAKYCGIAPKNVIAGNGSDEIISLICSGFIDPDDVVTVTVPDFSMYEFYSELAGGKIDKVRKDRNLKVDVGSLIDHVKKNRSKILIFSNPCNPTGQLIYREEIARLCKSLDETLVVVDEAYMEFAGTNESVIDLINETENLIVLKTLSKAFGSAAMRLGFAISNRDLITAIRKIKSPYNVNTISQTFGTIILRHDDEIKKNIAMIKENTKILRDNLSNGKNNLVKRVFDTETNFVFIDTGCAENAHRITDAMHASGIAIRCMGDSGFIRVSAGTKDETEALTRVWNSLGDEYDE